MQLLTNSDREKIILINKKLKIPYPMKNYYQTIIPLNLYQTWHTKSLPTNMFNAVRKLKTSNPAFNYQLYDDNDCREFIKNNFNGEILNAFDNLIPGAYKADLWRYCILYKNGGIYLDIKYVSHNNFKLITLTEKEHWVLDADKNGVYNALMVCKPGNELLLKAINQVVLNVKNKYYGNGPQDPTGPILLSTYFTNHEKNNFELTHEYYYSYDNRFILYNGYYVFKSYNGYLEEHQNYKKNAYYCELWNARQIYK
jgi:mannosyltransferase OCH1-like enzyme